MDSKPAVLKFTNLPADVERKEYFTAFSKYGNVKKLYICPSKEFGEVYFDNMADACKAREELHNKPPLHLVIQTDRQDRPSGIRKSNTVDNSSVGGKSSRSNHPQFTTNFNENSNTCKLREELRNKPPLHLNIQTDEHDHTISSVGRKSSTTNFSQFLTNFSDKNSCEVETVDSGLQFVDIYGRLLDTLQSEDGEIYVPASELKKSGFLIFPEDSLPKQGELPSFDKQVFNQFTVYLKAKAFTFMMRRNLNFSEHQVNTVVDTLKNEYREMHNAGSSANITAPPQNRFPNSKSKCSTRQPRLDQPFDNNMNNQQGFPESQVDKNTNVASPPQDRYRNPRNKSSTRQSQLDRPFDGKGSSYSHSREYRSNIIKQHGFQEYQLDKGGSSGNPNPRNKSSTCPPHLNRPFDGKYTSYSHTREYRSNTNNQHDGNQHFNNKNRSNTFVPRQDSKLPSQSASLMKNLPQKPSNKPGDKDYEYKQKIEYFQPESSSKMTIAADINLPLTIISKRINAIEKVSSSGFLDCVDIVGEDTFVAAVMPAEFADEIALLDLLTEDCRPDPYFKAYVRDTVAVLHDGVYVRGTVINIVNEKYSCALIDYGVVVTVDEVQSLPDKYKDIPEFACLCKTDRETLQAIAQENKENFLQIKSPWLLTVTLKNSDKVCEIRGSQWNPFETSPLALQTTFEENVTQPKKLQLKPDDIVILVSQNEGYLLVRTKELYTFFKQVTEEITKFEAKPLHNPPKINQLCLCPHKDEGLFRAVVLSVNEATVTVEYIDYGNCDTVPIKDLKNISEKLATIDNTLIKISLQEFVGTQFSSEALDFLSACCTKRDKFRVIPGDGNHIYDLICDDKTKLSEKLASLDKSSTPATSESTEMPLTHSLSVMSGKSTSLEKSSTTATSENAEMPSTNSLSIMSEKLASLDKSSTPATSESNEMPLTHSLPVMPDKSTSLEKSSITATSEKAEMLSTHSLPVTSEKPTSLDKLSITATSENTEMPLPNSSPVISEKLTSVDNSSTPAKSETTEMPPSTHSSPVMSEDVPNCKFNLGINQAMCIFAGNLPEGIASFCEANPEKIDNIIVDLSLKIMAFVEANDDSHHPIQNEVCLAKFEGEWYRAVITEIVGNDYKVLYIDYGNSNIVSAENIREMPKELSGIERLSSLCYLKDVKENQPVKEGLLSKLQNSIIENGIYDINVLSEDSGGYVITIPSLFDGWKDEGLLP